MHHRVEKFRVHLHDPPRRAAHVDWVKEEERLFYSDLAGEAREESPKNCHKEPAKKVEWLELFFDLVFVAVFAQTSELLAEANALNSPCKDENHHGRLLSSLSHDGPFGMNESQMLVFSYFFAAFFSVKVWAMECHINGCVDGCNDVFGRFLTFLVMGGFAGMCANVHGGVGDINSLQEFVRNLGGIYLWFFMKACRVAYNLEGAPKRAWRILAVIFLTQCISTLLVGYLITSREALIISTLAIGTVIGQVINYSTGLSKTLNEEMPPHPSHLAERYGLFMIIVLGEATVHAINGSAAHFRKVGNNGAFRGTAVLGGLLSFVPIFAVWWRYFDNFDERVGFFRISANLWKLCHYLLAAAIGGVASSLGFMLDFSACEDLKATLLPSYAQNMAMISIAAMEFFLGFIIIINMRRKQRDKGVFSRSRYRLYWLANFSNVAVLLLMNLISFTPFGLLGYLGVHYIALICIDVTSWHAIERSLRRMRETSEEAAETQLSVSVTTSVADVSVKSSDV